jgi:hypothetical protein
VSLAAARPATAGVPVDLLDAYAQHVATLTISKAGRAARLRAAQRFLTRHPDLGVWMGRPTPQRLVDLHRAKAWPLLSWCVIAGHLRPDLELLLARPGGVELPTTWTRRHPDDVGRVAEVGAAVRLEQQLDPPGQRAGPCTMGCWAGKPLDGLTEDDFAGITADWSMRHTCRPRPSSRRNSPMCGPSATTPRRVAGTPRSPATPASSPASRATSNA